MKQDGCSDRFYWDFILWIFEVSVSFAGKIKRIRKFVELNKAVTYVLSMWMLLFATRSRLGRGRSLGERRDRGPLRNPCGAPWGNNPSLAGTLLENDDFYDIKYQTTTCYNSSCVSSDNGQFCSEENIWLANINLIGITVERNQTVSRSNQNRSWSKTKSLVQSNSTKMATDKKQTQFIYNYITGTYVCIPVC